MTAPATTIRRTARITKPAQDTSVLILARYFIKASGDVILHVRNGEQKEYCVTLRADSTVDCYDKNDKQCPGHKYAHRAGHECHHILHCQMVEQERKASVVVEATADPEYLDLSALTGEEIMTRITAGTRKQQELSRIAREDYNKKLAALKRSAA